MGEINELVTQVKVALAQDGPDKVTSLLTSAHCTQTCPVCERREPDLSISEKILIIERLYVNNPNLFPGSITQKLRPEGFWDRGSGVGSQGCSLRQEPGSGG